MNYHSKEPKEDEIKVSLNRLTPALLAQCNASINNKVLDAMLDGRQTVIIKKAAFEKALKKKAIQDEKNAKLFKTAELNNEGIALEKAGKIEEAISIYEDCISIGYPAAHSYERLMILYRKAKDFKNEIRIIKIALKVYKKDPKNFTKYSERLEKAIELQSKQS